MKSKKFPSLDVGPAFDEMTGFHRGETPDSQPGNAYRSGSSAMNISAKHNPTPLKKEQRTPSTEPAQYQ